MAKKAMKSAKAKSTTKRAKPVQQTIDAPGMKRDVHPDIETAAERYAEAKVSHRASTEEVTEAQTTLLAKMKEHGVPKCIVDVDGEQHVVEVETDERAKMRKYDPEKEAIKAAKKANGASESVEASP